MVRIAHGWRRKPKKPGDLPNRRGLSTVAHLELFQYLLHVFVHGGGRNAQLAGDLAVGPPLANLTPDRSLSSTQQLSFVVEVLKRTAPARPNSAHAAEEVSRDRLLTASDAPQRAQELAHRQVFRQIGGGSRS